MFQIIWCSTRQVVIEVQNRDIYETEFYDIYLNQEFLMRSKKVIQSIHGLCPDTSYGLEIRQEHSQSDIMLFTTDKEFVTLNVKDFGAKGDNLQNDTVFIQSAISACPENGRILIPKGIYRVTSLFLKSNLMIELAKDAIISVLTDSTQFPIFPGLIESYDEEEEYNLGTWEGNPLDMFTGILTGVNVSNVIICGQGTIEGNASYENWWKDAKKKKRAFRPRLLFLNHCSHVIVQGITFQNSPSWCMHPYFSSNLRFLDLTIVNPKDSPNTDGLDPESCKDVEILGCYFSLGDDCIALKSGKIYMGGKYKTPSENIIIRQCYMRDGHGSITIGSEMSGGVKNILVKDCRFFHTDRGLRIKTRRGRGMDGVIDQIEFNHVIMDHVMTPIVINAFYFCDPDGHSVYVSTKEPLDVDERTPIIGSLMFQNIRCSNCHVACAFIYGLPEMKIKKIIMKNISFEYAENPVKGFPAMMDGIHEMSRGGILAYNIEELELIQVEIAGEKITVKDAGRSLI